MMFCALNGLVRTVPIGPGRRRVRTVPAPIRPRHNRPAAPGSQEPTRTSTNGDDAIWRGRVNVTAPDFRCQGAPPGGTSRFPGGRSVEAIGQASAVVRIGGDFGLRASPRGPASGPTRTWFPVGFGEILTARRGCGNDGSSSRTGGRSLRRRVAPASPASRPVLHSRHGCIGDGIDYRMPHQRRGFKVTLGKSLRPGLFAAAARLTLGGQHQLPSFAR